MSDDKKQVLKGLSVGAGVGIVGSLISGASHWLGGPKLGFSQPSLKNIIGVGVSTGVASLVLGVGIDQYEKWEK